MTNHAELIAEAEKALLYTSGGEVSDLPERLAAALRECAVPEGWIATEYVHGKVYSLRHPRVAQKSNGFWVATHGGGEDYYTAFAAMAALDGDAP